MYAVLKKLLQWLLRALYRVEVRGLEHFHQAGRRVLIVANHTSFIDGVLLGVFLPGRLTFAVHTSIAEKWYARVVRLLVELFPMDPLNPLSTKSLIKYLRSDRRAVVFPEGRITVTGSLMKIYQGPGLVAHRSQAMVLPVRIEGAQYSVFSRLRGRVRLRWFPRIRLSVLPPRRLEDTADGSGHARRDRIGKQMEDLMTEMIFATGDYRTTLVDSLLDACRVHGAGHVVVEDVERRPRTYRQLITRALIAGRVVAGRSRRDERLGILLPNLVSTVTLFLAMHFRRRVPAMLNYTAGARGMLSACRTAGIRTVFTSRRFVATARLEAEVGALSGHVEIVYLEDIARGISAGGRLRAYLQSFLPGRTYRRYRGAPDDAAVVLFTSGSEGEPKGVVLSHSNLLANRQQLGARIDFGAQDVILNPLPMFHAFGLTAGTVLPLLSGIRTFFYPSPLHYRIVPEVAYDINATIMFGTNTFLAGYARFAHPYDFYSIRYVFAGAERLQDEVRRTWEDKFGVRIFEGYGATETSPVIAANTAMANRPGTVGRLLPGMGHRLQPVPGVKEGGRLHVSGPNVMLGYLLSENPGVLVAPRSAYGAGWYDTGDIVSIDDEGFLIIQGRARRFAKVGGEMVSLASVEALAGRTWPGAHHAAVALPGGGKGEELVLVTDCANAGRKPLLERARLEGVGEINVPRRVVTVKAVPVLGTGKTDYGAVQALAEGRGAGQ